MPVIGVIIRTSELSSFDNTDERELFNVIYSSGGLSLLHVIDDEIWPELDKGSNCFYLKLNIVDFITPFRSKFISNYHQYHRTVTVTITITSNYHNLYRQIITITIINYHDHYYQIIIELSLPLRAIKLSLSISSDCNYHYHQVTNVLYSNTFRSWNDDRFEKEREKEEYFEIY